MLLVLTTTNPAAGSTNGGGWLQHRLGVSRAINGKTMQTTSENPKPGTAFGGDAGDTAAINGGALASGFLARMKAGTGSSWAASR